ncbi:hypothetical protein HK102_009929, partial [Quaeritorhiza haematococci]
ALTGPRKFTWAEIEASASPNPKSSQRLVVIHNKVYDVGADFINWHPGGRVVLSQVGKDGSGAFEVFHTESTTEILANYYVGDLAEGEVKKPNAFEEEVRELNEQFQKEGLYNSNKLYYLFKFVSTTAIWAASVGLLTTYSDNVWGVLASALLMAVFWQQSGWLAHDFLHHQVFQNRSYNDLAGYLLGNVYQGFSVSWWKNKHCTHHSVPNVHKGDPDIDTMPLLAWSEHALEFFADVPDNTLAQFLVRYQAILYFPILALARLSWALSSILYTVPGSIGQLKKDDVYTARIERISLAVHWA